LDGVYIFSLTGAVPDDETSDDETSDDGEVNDIAGGEIGLE
jgi:hypothetical protein